MKEKKKISLVLRRRMHRGECPVGALRVRTAEMLALPHGGAEPEAEQRPPTCRSRPGERPTGHASQLDASVVPLRDNKSEGLSA